MIRLSFIVFSLVIVVFSDIRCWEGQQTIPGQGTTFQETFCPGSDFCFNNYVKRHHDGDDSYTLSKSCGQPGKCFEAGCEGPNDEKRCCCVGDLCNFSSKGLGLTAGILALIYNL